MYAMIFKNDKVISLIMIILKVIPNSCFNILYLISVYQKDIPSTLRFDCYDS